ncbi:MAG: DUF4868 domain-containing protein [bacterium]|nr:DUF4868 domain-containing protein [bacterium]
MEENKTEIFENQISNDNEKIENTEPEHVDIFQWANLTDGVKNEIDVEFFLFNKNFAPFTVQFSSELNSQIKPLFLFDMINFVNMGAGTGLSVRDYEMDGGASKDVLLRTDLQKVQHADALINVIETQYSDILEFNEGEHEFKRMKGILARFTDKNGKKFYVAKQIMQGQVLRGATAWEFRDGKFGAFEPEFGLKIQPDNQVLIIENDIFAFNPSKFEKLFNYDYKKQVLADKKVVEIESKYRLSFPDGLDLQTLVREKRKVASKLEKMENIGEIEQEKVIEYADEMQLELMTDDNGAIIIMDGNDLDMFVNLINEDYILSEITGKRYEIKSKKLLDEPDGEPPRMIG